MEKRQNEANCSAIEKYDSVKKRMEYFRRHICESGLKTMIKKLEDNMNKFHLDMEKYKRLARQAGAEGCVLLKNDNETLPVKKGSHVAVFGRCAIEYYKSGLGSGGLVNTRYVTGITDALKSCPELELDAELLGIYESWLAENPFDNGRGWGQVPWCQKEMPVNPDMLRIAAEADISLIVIGRTAGEDQDTKAEKGGYYLTDTEEALIREISAAAKKTAVLLNVGNIIDMSWVKTADPDAVLYVWQGGQEGGNGVADVLTGKENPSGRLTDTIAERIEDYPSTKNFGSTKENIYQEDIYLGYRYFETFAPEKVLYPFGFGLSYTTFAIEKISVSNMEWEISFTMQVRNTGNAAGREVVQVYVQAPQGKLGKPVRSLVGFGKTEILAPGETAWLTIEFPKYYYASFDDSGVTGNKSCFVMEKGKYEFYIGENVRDAKSVWYYEEEARGILLSQSAAGPVQAFRRMHPVAKKGGKYIVRWEEVPFDPASEAGYRQNCDGQNESAAEAAGFDDWLNPNPYARYGREAIPDIPYTGDRGIRLSQVLDGEATMEEFLAQIPDTELIRMFYGEGMCSARVTPGTASAFGGVSPYLEKLGVPVGCCSDGPSGIRMDCGTKAFSLPIGTLLGCTFNEELVEELYAMLGLELRLNRIDSLLGPGMNLHRNPLNGRNFEYISEDPLLTGKIAAAQVRGMDRWGVGSTIKHFCANNQEAGRRSGSSVVSERALRELYLRGFEIAVREGHARSVMTTYGALNGIWTAGNRDLCTKILRDEWGFDGIVMTDWWGEANYQGEEASRTVRAPMILAQNDLCMCVSDASLEKQEDDVIKWYGAGRISRGVLLRNARNILSFLLKSPAMLRLEGRISDEEKAAAEDMKDKDDVRPDELSYYIADGENCVRIPGSALHPRRGKSDVFGIQVKKMGVYSISMRYHSDLDVLAQLAVPVFCDNVIKCTFALRGTNGETLQDRRELDTLVGNTHFIKLHYAADGLKIEELTIRLEKEISLDF